jgi:hypothetical protein
MTITLRNIFTPSFNTFVPCSCRGILDHVPHDLGAERRILYACSIDGRKEQAAEIASVQRTAADVAEGIDATAEPDGIALRVSPEGRVVVPMPVIY